MSDLAHHDQLTDTEIRRRVLATDALKAFLANSQPITFVDDMALVEIAERNDCRREAQLTLLDVRHELTRSRTAYIETQSAGLFSALSASVIKEVYGTIYYRDFTSMSALALFYARHRKVLSDILQQTRATER